MKRGINAVPLGIQPDNSFNIQLLFNDMLRLFRLNLTLLVAVCVAGWFVSCSSGDDAEEVKPQLTVDQSEVAVETDGGTFSLSVVCNVAYEVSLPSAVEWIALRGAAEGSPSTSSTHQFVVKANENYASRTANIRFRTKSTPEVIADVKVTQMQRDAILVANKSHAAKPEGGLLNFTVNTNVNFQVACSEAWIQPATTTTRALEEKKLSFQVEANETKADRKATITLTYGTIKQKIEVTQARYYRDREALLALYKAAGGDSWKKNSNWGSEATINNWYGVSTDDDGRVTGIDLSDNGLVGSAEEIFNALARMDKLHSIRLSNNQIAGELPESLAALKELEWFVADQCAISGQLPTLFCEMENLSWFSLYMNKLSGTIPEAYGDFFTRHLDREMNFYVGYNYLTGDLPQGIVNHPSFVRTWHFNLAQYSGYGFNPVDIPAFADRYNCTDGTSIDLKSLYAANKYTLLYYWGRDFPTTTSFIPRVKALYQKYGQQGLGVVGVCYPVDPNDAQAVEEQDIFEQEMRAFKHIRGDNVPILFSDVLLFLLVDSQGHIVRFNCTEYSGFETISQFISGFGNLLDYTAQCFGDAKFEYDFYTSTDYSHDGEVLTLQKASKGQGIDLVFVGEAFTDQDMAAGGRYEQVMQQAVEQFFAYEPYTSLRNRFNCYAVKAVSANGEFGTGSVHAFDESIEKCKMYYYKAPVNSSAPKVIVVYNTGCQGRSYTQIWTDGAFYGFCMTGVDDVLVHEVCGHGMGNLGDEYIEPGHESHTLPQDQANLLSTYHSRYNWYQNLDWRSDPTQVEWAHIISDQRFAAERVGVYEGAFYYGYGAYRPTENSMMRYNDCGFNAPSRELIYKRVMKLSEGSLWTYDYETFVKFDEPARRQATTRALQPLKSESEREAWRNSHRAPVIIDAHTGEVIH